MARLVTDMPAVQQVAKIRQAAGGGELECLCCGACCRQLIIEADALGVLREPRIAQHCRLLDGHGEITQPGDWTWSIACGPTQPCPFLTQVYGFRNTCRIYANRPADCVGMQPGSPQCRESRAAEGLLDFFAAHSACRPSVRRTQEATDGQAASS